MQLHRSGQPPGRHRRHRLRPAAVPRRRPDAEAEQEATSIDYSKTVKAGLDFLIAKQGKDGYFGGSMYSHGIATIAICEAYGMTSDPTLKAPAQKAIRFIETAQDVGRRRGVTLRRRPATCPSPAGR